jgi:hypothetical protein
MLETEIRFNTKIKTILVGEKNINVIDGITQLLPFNFSNKDL